MTIPLLAPMRLLRIAIPLCLASAATVLTAQNPPGVLVGLGENSWGELNVSIGSLQRTPRQIATGIARIQTTSNQSYLLTTDGRLLAAGSNAWHPWGDDPNPVTTFTQVAANVADFSANYTHLLTVDSAGVLRASGTNSAGQLGPNAPALIPEPIILDTGVTVVSGDSAAGTLWLKANGSLWGMGTNFGNPLGVPGGGPVETPVQVATNVARIASSGGSTLYLDNDGALWGLGNNYWGQLGLGHRNPQDTPAKIAEHVIDAQNYAGRTLFVTADGTLWGMGFCAEGELGPNAQHPQLVPLQIATGVRSVSLDQYHTLWVDSDGTAWGFGRNTAAQLGLGDTRFRPEPTRIMDQVAAVSTGTSHTLFLKTDGSVWGAGLNRYGLLGSAVPEIESTPQRSTSRIRAIASAGPSTFFLRDDQTLWSVGSNQGNVRTLGALTDFSESANLVATSVAKVANGGTHALFLKTDGTVWFVGDPGEGRYGSIPAPPPTVPVQIATDAVEIGASSGGSFFIDRNGGLWGTGQNHAYQLGLGHTNTTYRFTRIASDVTAVFPGGVFTAFLKRDGSFWTMGTSYTGALGPNTGHVAPTPVFVAGNVATAACNASNTYFVTKSGDLYGLGANSRGQLGHGAAHAENSTPQLIARSATACAAGESCVVWIDETGDLWGLGRAEFGELGEPLVTATETPRLLARQVTAVAASANRTLYAQVPEAYLTNLSTRVKLPSTGDGRLTAGFVIAGTEPLTVLIRAVGPTLSLFEVPDAMPDPTLRIFNAAGVPVAANDDWSAENTAELSAVAIELGAFALPPGSADAAVLVTLPPGPYSAVVERGGAPGGVVLLEVYNRNPRVWRSRLVNLSVRTDAGTDGDTVTAGFVVEGKQDARLLVRAIGPTLGDFGVPSFLVDPQLAVLRGQTTIAASDDWAGAEIADQAAEVGAFALPVGSRDAATLVNLSPGAYTSQVLPKSGASGNTMVEVYVVDR